MTCPNSPRSTLEGSPLCWMLMSVSLTPSPSSSSFHHSQHCTLLIPQSSIQSNPIQLTAGKDATTPFFGLHRQEILYSPRYAHLRIGQIQGEKQLIRRNAAGSLSEVPYGEPMWLGMGYKRSPYYKESHYALQKGEWGMRKR